MYRTILVMCAHVALVNLTIVSSSWALPPDQEFEYNVYEDPQDPNSDIVFTVTAVLEAKEVVAGEVAWLVASLDFVQPGVGGGDWSDDSPVVDTPDGKWWVAHADTENPDLAEFVESPLLEGEAISLDPMDDDLEYSLEGNKYTPPGVHPITVSLDYSFQRVGASTPEEEADDEPTELDEIPGTGG